MERKKPTIPLKEVPLDVRKYMLKIQGEAKERKGISQYSLSLTVFQIIREHKSLIKKGNYEPMPNNTIVSR